MHQAREGWNARERKESLVEAVKEPGRRGDAYDEPVVRSQVTPPRAGDGFLHEGGVAGGELEPEDEVTA